MDLINDKTMLKILQLVRVRCFKSTDSTKIKDDKTTRKQP